MQLVFIFMNKLTRWMHVSSIPDLKKARRYKMTRNDNNTYIVIFTVIVSLLSKGTVICNIWNPTVLMPVRIISWVMHGIVPSTSQHVMTKLVGGARLNRSSKKMTNLRDSFDGVNMTLTSPHGTVDRKPKEKNSCCRNITHQWTCLWRFTVTDYTQWMETAFRRTRPTSKSRVDCASIAVKVDTADDF